MNKTCFVNYCKMQKIAAVFIVVSLLSCFSINYTFPLHRDAAKLSGPVNNTLKCVKSSDSIVDRTKKMATNIENALKKIMDAAQDNDKTRKDARCSHAKQGLIDNDLSNYEQLVIMKKYPYLDLKELENYQSLPHKSVRQSLHTGPTLEQESGYCESSVIAGPNVDITNRGLTGFAIPTKLVKTDDSHNSQIQSISTSETAPETLKTQQSSVSKSSDNSHLLESLEEDIQKFEEKLRG